VLILSGGGLPTLEKWRDQHTAGPRHLGRLARPRHASRLRDTLDAGFRVGVDNDAFSDWNLPLFAKMVHTVQRQVFGRVLSPRERLGVLAPLGVFGAPIELPGSPPPPPPPPWHENLLWLTVPDVPFDAAMTAKRWSVWAPLMAGLPLALCVQDGAGDVGIPWDWPGLRCLFMAGSTEYKLSSEMADICREGKKRGLWIHCGRVNSRKRIKYLLGLDFVDSIDGTGFDRYRNAHLPWGLDEVSKTTYQLVLAP
jgi:hypothetical protein